MNFKYSGGAVRESMISWWNYFNLPSLPFLNAPSNWASNWDLAMNETARIWKTGEKKREKSFWEQKNDSNACEQRIKGPRCISIRVFQWSVTFALCHRRTSLHSSIRWDRDPELTSWRSCVWPSANRSPSTCITTATGRDSDVSPNAACSKRGICISKAGACLD